MLKQYKCTECGKNFFNFSNHAKSTGHNGYKKNTLLEMRGVTWNEEVNPFTRTDEIIISLLEENPEGVTMHELVLFLYGEDTEETRRSSRQLIFKLRQRLENRNVGTLLPLDARGIWTRGNDAKWTLVWSEK